MSSPGWSGTGKHVRTAHTSPRCRGHRGGSGHGLPFSVLPRRTALSLRAKAGDAARGRTAIYDGFTHRPLLFSAFAVTCSPSCVVDGRREVGRSIAGMASDAAGASQRPRRNDVVFASSALDREASHIALGQVWGFLLCVGPMSHPELHQTWWASPCRCDHIGRADTARSISERESFWSIGMPCRTTREPSGLDRFRGPFSPLT
jgi:hypothetical protein